MSNVCWITGGGSGIGAELAKILSKSNYTVYISGRTKSKLCNIASDNKSIIWTGKGINEIGRRADNNKIVVRVDSRYFRPNEVENLLGDSSYAKNILGWEPTTSLEELVHEMVTSDLVESKKEFNFGSGLMNNNSLDS